MDLPKINIFDLRLSQLGGWVGGGGGWGVNIYFPKLKTGKRNLELIKQSDNRYERFYFGPLIETLRCLIR